MSKTDNLKINESINILNDPINPNTKKYLYI